MQGGGYEPSIRERNARINESGECRAAVKAGVPKVSVSIVTRKTDWGVELDEWSMPPYKSRQE